MTSPERLRKKHGDERKHKNCHITLQSLLFQKDEGKQARCTDLCNVLQSDSALKVLLQVMPVGLQVRLALPDKRHFFIDTFRIKACIETH